MIIELVGAIGAGKSTLAGALQEWLSERGFEALSPADGLSRCLARSPSWRLACRLLYLALGERRGRRATVRVGRTLALMRFVLAHPRLAWLAARSAGELPLPRWHRRTIRRLFFQVAAEYQFLRGRLRPDEVVVFDEGFVHRAVNLYGWRENGIDRALLSRYFARLPASDLVVLVTAPAEHCAARSRERGLPRRLRGQEEKVISRLLANSALIAGLAAGYLAESERPYLVVENGGPLAESVAALRAALERLPTMEIPASWSRPVFPALSDGR